MDWKLWGKLDVNLICEWLFTVRPGWFKQNFNYFTKDYPSMKAYILEGWYPLSLKSCINCPLRKLRFCKWGSAKMQQIIKQAGPSRQLFETINFAFMNFFDFFVKTAIFRTFLLFSGDFRQALQPYTVWLEHLIRADMHDENLSEKRRNALKWLLWLKNEKFS